jgi:hypothetical protein
MGLLAMFSYKQEMKQTKGDLKEDKKASKRLRLKLAKKVMNQ